VTDQSSEPHAMRGRPNAQLRLWRKTTTYSVIIRDQASFSFGGLPEVANPGRFGSHGTQFILGSGHGRLTKFNAQGKS
jgi:hypothetical protein